MLRQKYKNWGIDEVIQSYPGLRIIPNGGHDLVLTGVIDFCSSAKGLEEISDAYEVEISVPTAFPKQAPSIKELGNRIPSSGESRYHVNPNGTLCLGSPLRLLLTLHETPNLLVFIQAHLIPFLYGYSFFEKHKYPPFGELAHGDAGLIEDYMNIFNMPSKEACIKLLWLGGLKKRHANKYICPCGSKRRLGKCHNSTINLLRLKLGRLWFSIEASQLRHYLHTSDEKT